MKKTTYLLIIALITTLAASSCTKSPEEKRQAYLASAQGYVKEGKLAEAAIQYQNALQIAPDDAKTLVSLGEVQLKLNRPQEAYASFSKAAKADASNVKAREYLASMYLLARKYDLAQQEAQAILKLQPSHTLAKEVLAQALFMTGKRDDGVKLMESLLAQEKPTEEMFINTIQMYMATGRATDALALVDRGAALYPSSVRLRFIASDIYAVKRDTASARRWAEEAYRVSGGNMSAGVALAMFYVRNNLDELYRAQLAELREKHPQSPEPYLLEATVLQAKGDLDGALGAATKARSLKDTSQVRTLIAQILLEKKQPAKAKDILRESIKLDREDLMSKILLAQILLEEKDASGALEILQEPIKKIPTSPEVASLAAQAYLLKGDAKKARDLVESALHANEQNVTLHKMMAKIAFLQQEYSKARAEADFLITKKADTPDILYIGALSALREGGHTVAAPYVDALVKKAPDEWVTLHVQILSCLERKDLTQAFAFAEKAADKYPENEEALALYASLAPRTAGWKKAVDKVKASCSKRDTSHCHMILAYLLEGSGDKAGALEEIKRAIAMEPGRNAYYHALAQFFVRNNMLKKALDEYEAILNKHPDDLAAASMIALLQQSSGDEAAARKTYEYILKRNPKHGLAANNMAWILAKGGSSRDLDEAFRLAQVAKDMYPDDPRVADTLGYVYLKKGLADNALGQFQMALEKLPDEPTVLYHKALALAELKRNQEALATLTKALGTRSGFPEKREAEALMARLRSKS